MALNAAVQQGVDASPKVVSNIVGSAFPKRRLERQSIVEVGNAFGLFSVPIRISWEDRVAVHAALFKCDPKWTEVSFFEDVDADVVRLRQFDGWPMNWPTISKQDDICGPMRTELFCIELRQSLHRAAVSGGLAASPIHSIPYREIDLAHTVPELA